MIRFSFEESITKTLICRSSHTLHRICNYKANSSRAQIPAQSHSDSLKCNIQHSCTHQVVPFPDASSVWAHTTKTCSRMDAPASTWTILQSRTIMVTERMTVGVDAICPLYIIMKQGMLLESREQKSLCSVIEFESLQLHDLNLFNLLNLYILLEFLNIE